MSVKSTFAFQKTFQIVSPDSYKGEQSNVAFILNHLLPNCDIKLCLKNLVPFTYAYNVAHTFKGPCLIFDEVRHRDNS